MPKLVIRGTWKDTDTVVVLTWENGKITGEPEYLSKLLATVAESCIDLRDEGIVAAGKASDTPRGFYLFCLQELDDVKFLLGTDKVFAQLIEQETAPEDAIMG